MKRLLLILLILAIPLYATDYYVDVTTGNDGDSGLTEELAWKTMGKVEAYDNATGFNPGDNIYFKAGETWSGANATTITFETSGTSGNPITYGKYGEGADPIIQINSGQAFLGRDDSYITIQDLEIDGIDDSFTPIQFGNELCTNIIIQRCVIYDGNSGIALHMVNIALVDDCTVYNCSNTGILMQGSAANRVSNVTVSNCTVHDIAQNDGIVIHHDGGYNTAGTNFYFNNNLVYSTGEQGFDLTAGDHITLYKNETYDCSGSIVFGHEVDSVTVDRHYSHDEKGEGMIINISTNLVIKNSILYNPVEDLIQMVASCEGCEIYNCVFIYGPDSTEAFLNIDSATHDDVTFKNNIFTSTENAAPTSFAEFQSDPATLNFVFDYNIWWRGDGDDTKDYFTDTANGAQTHAEWVANYSFEANSVFMDNPDLVEDGFDEEVDFKITTDSPAKDAGENGLAGADFWGTERPSGVTDDMGCHEFDQGEAGTHNTVLKSGLTVILGSGVKLIFK